MTNSLHDQILNMKYDEPNSGGASTDRIKGFLDGFDEAKEWASELATENEPKWIRITDDPATWPENNELCRYTKVWMVCGDNNKVREESASTVRYIIGYHSHTPESHGYKYWQPIYKPSPPEDNDGIS